MTAGAVLSALFRVSATQKTDNESRQEMTVPNAANDSRKQANSRSRQALFVCGLRTAKRQRLWSSWCTRRGERLIHDSSWYNSSPYTDELLRTENDEDSWSYSSRKGHFITLWEENNLPKPLSGEKINETWIPSGKPKLVSCGVPTYFVVYYKGYEIHICIKKFKFLNK